MTEQIVLRPLSDNLIVEPIEVKETVGGIILPELARKKPQEGMVLVIGPGRWDSKSGRAPMDMKKGDRVLFGKYAGTEIELKDGRKILVLKESDILAVGRWQE